MKKKILVLIVLLLLIIPAFKTYALEDSFYEGEYISGEYIKKFKNDSGKYQQMRVFRRNSDDQLVYCIELWEALQSNKIMTGYDNNQHTYTNIDYDTLKKVILISYYGYGYGDHTDIKWYVVTQFMIWQATSPESTIYFTDTLNGNKITKYVEEMNEINNLISEHSKKPSFNTKTFQVKYNEPYTLTDTNNVLEKFVISSSGGLTVNKSGNNLVVTSKRIGKSRLILVNNGSKYKTNPIVYVDNDGQDILAPGNYDPIYMMVDYELLKATVEINKLDIETNNISQGDAKLSGSKFQLLDINNNVISEAVVNEDVIARFENIGYGNYSLKEIASGSGYLINNNTLSIQVEEDIVKENFYNQVIKNTIIINKYLKNPLTGEILIEDDAIFSIYNSKNEKIMTFTTKNGIFEFELPYGRYLIHQESGAKNHSYIEDFTVKVIENGKVQSFNLYNEELTAKIKIINTDNDSKLPILEKGAQFKIKNLDTNKYVQDQENNILILESSNLGNTDFLALSSGKYQIEQVKAIEGYDINDSIFYFEITDETTFQIDENQNKYLEIEISNTKQKGQIEINQYTEYYLNDYLIKIEREINNAIPIYAKKDIYSKDGIKVYEKDQEVGSAALENGKLITSFLVFGEYYIKNGNDIITEITLNKIGCEKIKLLNKVYEYEEPVIDLMKTNNEVIIVPNTSVKESFSSNINPFLIVIGLLIIKRNKNHENN